MTISSIGIIAILCGAFAEQPALESPLLTGYKTTRIQEEEAGNPYDWGASVMFDDEAGVYRMWWCRLGGDPRQRFAIQATYEDGSPHPFSYPDYGDRIYYAESRDGLHWQITGPDFTGVPESYGPDSQGPLMVLKPSESADEYYHIGRPSVVKVEGVFYMYYEAPGACVIQRDKDGKTTNALEYHNQIFMASSKDGKTWNKHPDNTAPIPIISAPASNKEPGHYRYGLGQPSIYYKNGRFIMHYMDSCTGPGDFMVKLEADNPLFKNPTIFASSLPGIEGIPQGSVSRHAQTQIRYLDDCEYLIRPAYGTGRLGLMASRTGIFTPDSRADQPADVFPQLTCPDPRGGDYLERLFPTFLTDPHGQIRIENGCAVTFFSAGKGFKDASDTWDLCRSEITQEDLIRIEAIQRASVVSLK